MKIPTSTVALVSLLAVAGGAGIALADDSELERKVRPFLVELNAGDPDQTIARNGGMRVFARCTAVDSSLLFEILATSDQEFHRIDDNFPNPPNSERRLSVILREPPILTGAISAVVQADGRFIGLGIHVRGVGVLGFDCFAQGSAEVISRDDDD